MKLKEILEKSRQKSLSSGTGSLMAIQHWETVASRIPERRIGRFSIVKRPIKSGTQLPMHGVFGYDYAFFLVDATTTILYEGEKDPVTDPGGIWMSDTPFEYYGMSQLANRARPGRVLVGGLGLGILANLLARRQDISEVVAVEISPEVIQLVKPYLHPKVKVIQGDFIDVMYDLKRKGEEFGTVIADIFRTCREEELFKDVEMAMDDTYPDAEHLFWCFQQSYERDKIRLYLIWEEIRRERK